MDEIPLMPVAVKGSAERSVSIRSVSPIDSIIPTLSNLPVEGGRNEKGESLVSSATLHRSPWIVLLVIVYSALAVFAWSVIVILAQHPITTASYYYVRGGSSGSNLRWLYTQNHQWLRAARVIQSMVGVLAIPLSSAVCARAAVVFTQRPRKRATLRQLVTLSNRGWTDPAICGRLLSGGFRRYGSRLLVFAIFLNILAGLIPLLQSAVLGRATLQTPTMVQTIAELTDIPDLFHDVGLDRNLISIIARSAITSTYITDPQPRLWTNGLEGCRASVDETKSLSVPPCSAGTTTFANLSQLVDPFVASLPSGFNTGLIHQFLPRLNSTATREVVGPSEFPVRCGSLPGAFYAQYGHDIHDQGDIAGNWSLSACMPANQSTSPWMDTRDRQDISEKLYLNITASGLATRHSSYVGLFRITLNTTLGFFELPNYFNGQKPGPLLETWSHQDCATDGTHCQSTSLVQSPPLNGNYRRATDGDTDANVTGGMSNSSLALGTVTNKGPLLVTAMALFGESSFIFNRVNHPSMYLFNTSMDAVMQDIHNGVDRNIFRSVCAEVEPLMGLLMGRQHEQNTTDKGQYPDCVVNKITSDDHLQRQMEQWILSLANGFSAQRIVNAFEAAAYLANEAWLLHGASDPHLRVSYDLGAETEIPSIAKGGMQAISTLLAVYLTALLALALYSSLTPVWTHELNGFAMMRIGAALSDRIALVHIRDSDKVMALDETAGWIGDSTEGQGSVGELGLGARTKLTGSRRVRTFDPGP